jgi:type IV secretion system protein VirD4
MIIVRLMLIASVFVAAWCFALLSAMLPGPVLVLITVLGLMNARRRYQLTACGTARWATKADLKNPDKGLIIGRMDTPLSLFAGIRALFNPLLSSAEACQRFLRRRTDLVRIDPVHTAVFAPTGVGKGVSFVIPHLLTCPDSMVVVDFKGENARITAKARRAMGHRVVLLDPFKVVAKTPDTLNPLDFIDKNDPLAIDECRDLANALVIRTGQEKEPFWNDAAEAWIAAMTAAAVHFGREQREASMQGVRSLLTDPVTMEGIIKQMCDSDAWDGMLARLGHQLTHFKDKELGSTLTTTNRFMRFLDTLAIAESTIASSFDPAELRTGKMTVYLILPPDHMRAQSPLLRMWIGSLLRAVVRGGLQEKNRVHFVLDEAASLGHMEAIDDAVDKYRGYGVRLQFYFQSVGQLKKCFPDGQDQTLLSNTSQVFFGVSDNETAKYVSERLGEETIIVGSGGSNTGTSRQGGDTGQRSHSYSTGESESWSQQARRLLKPEEVAALPARIAITFMPGLPPIRTRLIRYYEENMQQGRLRKALSAVRMVAMSVLIFLFSLLVAALIVSPLIYHKSQPPAAIDEPVINFGLER